MEKYFLVRVEETLSRTYKIKARSLREAEEKMERAYREDGTVILDADDFVQGDIFGTEARDEVLDLYDELICEED